MASASPGDSVGRGIARARCLREYAAQRVPQPARSRVRPYLVERPMFNRATLRYYAARAGLFVLGSGVAGEASAQEAAARITDGSELFRTTTSAPCVRPTRRTLPGDTIVLREQSAYPCRLVFRETGIAIRGNSAGTVPDPGRRLARDSRGRLYTTIDRNPSQIAVWNPDGSYDTTISRAGQGPGELPSGLEPILYVDSSDRLHVRSSGGVWSIFGPDHKYIKRGVVMRAQQGWNAALDNGTVLSFAAAEGERNYFHVTDPATARVRSFGEVSPSVMDLNMLVISRGIASRGDTIFWAGPVTASGQPYVLDMWSTSGMRLKTFRRDVPWFPQKAVRDYGRSDAAHDAPDVPKNLGPPQPFARPLNVDGEGLPLVYVSVPNNRWRWIPDEAERRREEPGFENLHIEVIDPESGVVLAAEVTNDALRRTGVIPNSFIPGTRLGYRRTVDADGIATLSIVEYLLVAR